MKSRFFYLFSLSLKKVTPFFITVLMVIITVTPVHIPGYPGIVPLLTLASIFHWAVYKPELLPTYAVFLLGLLQDLLHGIPIGVNAAVFLLVYGGITSQSRFFFKKSFPIIWVGFGIVLASSCFLTWSLMSMLNATIIDPAPLYLEYLVTLGCYPAIAWTLLRWQRLVLSQV